MFSGQRFATGDAQAYRQGLVAAGQPLRQLAAIARGKAENRHLLFANQGADLFGVPLPLGAQDHPCAAQQRHQQALGGGVKVDRIEVQFAVVTTHAETFDDRLAVHGDLATADHHALGLAGGA
ncbi:hypothetical protein D3C77_176040 [compost metagenome]